MSFLYFFGFVLSAISTLLIASDIEKQRLPRGLWDLAAIIMSLVAGLVTATSTVVLYVLWRT